MEKYKAKILEIRKEGPSTVSYVLENPPGHSWEKGANTHVALKGYDNNPLSPDKSLIHHMSISTLPEEGVIIFSTRYKDMPSKYKKTLFDLKVGDFVTIYKTKSYVNMERKGENLVFLTMGVAVATFRPFILDYFNNPTGYTSMTLLNVDRDGEHIMEELYGNKDEISYQGIKINNRSEFKERIKNMAMENNTVFFIAGSEAMMVDTIKYLMDLGIESDRIILDRKPEICMKYKSPNTNIRSEAKVLI